MSPEHSTPPSADLTIVVPVYNEAAALPAFLAELLPFAAAFPAAVILVDDGSSDGTRDILAAVAGAQVTVLRHKLNRGYGGALKTGVAASRTRYTITVDADGQHRPEDIRQLYETIRRTDADMVIGSRRGQKDASLPRTLAKACIRLLAKSLMRVPVHDLNSGMKIVATRMAQDVLHLCPDTMAYSDTIALLFINRRGLVLEEPIQIRERQGRASTVGARDAIGTVRAIINMAMLFHPLNLFLPAALVLAILGLAWTARCYLINRVVSQGAAVLLLSALFTLLLGLLAEQLADEVRRAHRGTGRRARGRRDHRARCVRRVGAGGHMGRQWQLRLPPRELCRGSAHRLRAGERDDGRARAHDGAEGGMSKPRDDRPLTLRFTIDPCQGAAAKVVGMDIEDRPFVSMVRRGTRVEVTYGPKELKP